MATNISQERKLSVVSGAALGSVLRPVNTKVWKAGEPPPAERAAEGPAPGVSRPGVALALPLGGEAAAAAPAVCGGGERTARLCLAPTSPSCLWGPQGGEAARAAE